ncbi:HAD-like domain-containing protein [Mycena rebaudengoi]|nr:HAD-like domain-containing protein [Mycena rebaudengoi]
MLPRFGSTVLQRLAPHYRACRSIRLIHKFSAKSLKPPLAFVFDIDGVLIRGGDVLPAAKRALSILDGNNPLGMKLPYILLTNGGGISEQERCRKLSTQLGFKIWPNQYIQAHTILKSLAHKYADVPVLVLGGKLDEVRQVAIEYGFNNAYTTLDVLAWNKSVWPLHQLSAYEKAATTTVDFSRTPISSILVFHDPRNWGLDVQVICDVLQSGGVIGGPYIPDQHAVELVFCNPDLIWGSDFSRPRLGQGAFSTAFQAVFKALTGSTYPNVQFGKPTRATYDFAAEVLSERLKDMGHSGTLPPVYMIGGKSSLDQDIAGANAANWNSVLVKTGVFAGGKPTHEPTHYVEDVEEAVQWAIRREIQRSQFV